MVFAMTLCYSCSSDDEEDGTLETPAYKSSSALYKVTQSGSALSSVEFTESGNYVIIKNNTRLFASQSRAMDKRSENIQKLPTWFLASPCIQAISRSTTYNNIITGKYTKVDDSTYVLEGFGTIKVNADNGSNYSLTITENGAASYTLRAEKKEQDIDSDQTDKLCRTWYIKTMSLKMSGTVKYEGNDFNFNIDEKVNGGDLAGLMYKLYESLIRKLIKESGQGVPENMLKEELSEYREQFQKSYPYLENMLFTQAGTYMVMYRGEQLGVATWTWVGSDFKKIRYSWDYNNMYGNLSNECEVEFKGSRCYIVENQTGSNVQGVNVASVNSRMTYELEEVR